MTTTTKRILSLVALYCIADVLFKVALRFEPWVALGLVPVGWLFVHQAMTLYRERRARKKSAVAPSPTADA